MTGLLVETNFQHFFTLILVNSNFLYANKGRTDAEVDFAIFISLFLIGLLVFNKL